MDSFEMLFAVVGLIIALTILIPTGIGLFAAAFGNLSESKKLKKAQDSIQNAGHVNGVICDAALVQDNTAYPLHYKYSIQYTDTYGQVHRAFIGISTKQPLLYAVGMPVSLIQLPAPVLDVPSEVLDPMRGADGLLPEKIRFRTYYSFPVDETSTLMFEEDYHALHTELGTKSEKAEKVFKATLVFGIVMCVLVAAAILGLIALLNADTYNPVM
ncbi:MAG: hypothetical protein MJ062_00130 [Oscillospiraceae bacterium]|nr:hypothetical protein [Oscillospiraceae bacterium]